MPAKSIEKGFSTSQLEQLSEMSSSVATMRTESTSTQGLLKLLLIRNGVDELEINRAMAISPSQIPNERPSPNLIAPAQVPPAPPGCDGHEPPAPPQAGEVSYFAPIPSVPARASAPNDGAVPHAPRGEGTDVFHMPMDTDAAVISPKVETVTPVKTKTGRQLEAENESLSSQGSVNVDDPDSEDVVPIPEEMWEKSVANISLQDLKAMLCQETGMTDREVTFRHKVDVLASLSHAAPQGLWTLDGDDLCLGDFISIRGTFKTGGNLMVAPSTVATRWQVPCSACPGVPSETTPTSYVLDMTMTWLSKQAAVKAKLTYGSSTIITSPSKKTKVAQ
jgi:hypothetical protein